MALLGNDTITLRAIEPTDVDLLMQWENDTATWSTTSTVAPFSRQLLWQYLERQTANPYADGELRLVATLSATGQAVGCIELTQFDALNGRAQVGILVAPQHRRHGHGLAMLQLLADYCRDHLGLHQLWAIVPCSNTASQHLFAAAGYTASGILRHWLHHGTTHDDATLLQLLL